MIALGRGIGLIDLRFLDTPQVIGTAVIQSGGTVALVDPGPSTCLEELTRELERHALRWADVGTVLLTHIHLDHGGAAGTIVRNQPHIRVVVHERGAPHLVDPSKLLSSATRLYGADMGRLWGEVAPVPAANVVSVGDGDRVEFGDRRLEVAYTPGHASHHVSYFDSESGIAFVGDTAGIAIMGRPYVLPAVPPPDVDLEAWTASAATIERWQPRTLLLTHFGPTERVRTHFQELFQRMDEMGRLVRRSFTLEGSDEDRMRWFVDQTRQALRREMSEEDAIRCERAAPPVYSWQGLARYWRKRHAT